MFSILTQIIITMKNFKSILNAIIFCLFIIFNITKVNAQDHSFYNTRLEYNFSADSIVQKQFVLVSGSKTLI
jgi:hypothetical protein